MQREIVYYPDPGLALRCEEIREITPEVRKLAEDMIETMYEKDGIGLAAPQIGENCRMVVVDITGPSLRADLKVLINPVIVDQEGETETEEGCLSVRELRAKVKRSEKVKVKALDLDGNEVEIDAEDLLSVCLQHEIDHLNGVLFIDRISRLKRSMYDKKVKKWLKQETANSV